MRTSYNFYFENINVKFQKMSLMLTKSYRDMNAENQIGQICLHD